MIKRRRQSKRRRARLIQLGPSFATIAALYRQCAGNRRGFGMDRAARYQRDVVARAISRRFARELRVRGLLHVEGYAPGSWAAKP